MSQDRDPDGGGPAGARALRSGPARGGKDDKARTSKAPKKATPDYLEKAALHYLERYASSRANLRRVLMGKVERSARFHGTDREDGAQTVEKLLDRLARAGYLDDAAYARGRAISLHRAGHGAQAIRMKLRQKGVDEDTCWAALESLEEEAEAPELAAALRYARKRRLGPYRAPDRRAANAERDMAALARKGFSLELARQVVLSDDLETLEEQAGAQPGPLG
jgi:regulatory protein